nr:GPI anchored wall transfer protein 1 [Hymenolepis microstoma]
MDPGKAKRHVEFVSGHTGGTALEIMGLLFILCFTCFIKLECERLVFRNFSRITTLIIDFFLILLQTVLPCTLLSNYLLEYCSLLLITVIIFELKAPKHPPRIPLQDGYMAFRRLVRVFVLLYTSICIYGVDLPFFPRRYAKTEVSGVSLMDVGVGMIVIAIGLSNAAFLDVAQTKSRSKIVSTLMKASLPCLLLGMFRTATVKALGYPDHETEYGIHWNFFFTLAFIRCGGILSTCAFSGMKDFDSMTIHFALCAALASIQQFLVIPMADHVFPHVTQPELSRPSPTGNFDLWWLVQANAEGIISLPGYLSLYFYATALGIAIRLHLEPPKKDGRSEEKLKFLCRQGNEEWYAFCKLSTMMSSKVDCA